MNLNRSQRPKIYQATDFTFELPSISQEQLPNQAQLNSLNLGVQEVVQLEIYFPAGLIHERQLGIAKTAASLLFAGTSKYTAFEISQAFEQVGASASCRNTSDYAIISLSCLSKHLSDLLPLLYHVISDAQFPQSELDIYIKQQEQSLQVQLKKCDFVANRLIDEYMFGFEHPYGSYLNLGDHAKLQAQDIRNFVTEHYKLSQAQIFLSGVFSEKTKEEVREIFGKPTDQGKVVSMPSFEINEIGTKKHRVTNDPESVQGAIRLGKRFLRNTDEDYTPMLFVNTLFGAYFGSRLMSNIREDKGYTYGIHSYIQHEKLDSSFMIATEAGKDVCEAAVQEVWNEMKILREEKVGQEELQLVKNYLLGSLLGSLDGPFQIMYRWKGLILNGFDAERFDRSVRIYKNIDATQIQELANKYLVPDSFYDLIVY